MKINDYPVYIFVKPVDIIINLYNYIVQVNITQSQTFKNTYIKIKKIMISLHKIIFILMYHINFFLLLIIYTF